MTMDMGRHIHALRQRARRVKPKHRDKRAAGKRLVRKEAIST